MDLVKKFTIHLIGKKRRTTIYMTEGMEDIIKEVGHGKISTGLKKLSLCAFLIREFDGQSFDRGYRRLCRTLEVMNEPDHDGNMVEAAKEAKSEMDLLEDEITNLEAELYSKKFKQGVAKMSKDVQGL
jgi:hypothetical protein